jgi:hypothetical protein
MQSEEPRVFISSLSCRRAEETVGPIVESTHLALRGRVAEVAGERAGAARIVRGAGDGVGEVLMSSLFCGWFGSKDAIAFALFSRGGLYSCGAAKTMTEKAVSGRKEEQGSREAGKPKGSELRPGTG